eukprot:2165735-Rhodomonas_salina.1
MPSGGRRALHVGDKVEVRLLALIPGLKISKQAEVLALDDTDSPAPTVTVRLSSGAIKTLPRANVSRPRACSCTLKLSPEQTRVDLRRSTLRA